MELKLRDFESINLFSNKNLEKVMSSVVNKSSNAVLVNMFEDSLILLDHTTGQFYSADYKFDQNKLTIKIDNFEPVELVKEESDLRDKIVEFFDDDEDTSAHDLTEVYKDDVLGQERFIDDLIHDAMMAKDFTAITDWSKVREVKEDVEIEDEKFFKLYQKRLETHPLMEVKLFDWENPVHVSLVDTEPRKIVNDSAVEKASELWKKEDFKEAFADAASTFVEDVEEGTEKMKDLLETYPQIFFLSGADRKALFGKAIITNKELKEEMEVLLKGIDIIFEKFDLAEMRRDYLEEAEFGMDEPPEEPKGEKAEIEPPEKKEKKPKESPPELSASELEKLAGELEKVAAKCEDESCKEKITSIANKLKAGKEEGTRPDVVKEAVSILSL
jgi:predicted house-cleaning NTP pyrophosphatase (Maf/HAM1 superfamily)